MKNLCLIALTFAIVVSGVAWGQVKESDGAITESGRFKRTLKLTLTGDKVAAPQTWLVEPSGKWTLTTKEGSKSGTFSAEQIAALAKDLEDFRLLDLPRDVVPRSKTPAQLYTLSFGNYTSTHELAAGKTLPTTDPARTDPLSLPANRFAAIVRGIQSRLK